MTNKSLFKTGLIGGLIAAICCFTPLLVILFSALGLGFLLGRLDWILLPSLVFFLFLMILGVYRLWREKMS
jgi:mercuric ion transport protein